MKADVAVIGGGPAGLAAAVEAKKCGAGRVVILERDRELGGILNQCIHSGFGLQYFGEELTGPEYAARFIRLAEEAGVETKLETMALDIDAKNRRIIAINPKDGYFELTAGAIVLAMGCRERTRGSILIPGDRPAGIFTAGAAQRYINIEGYMVGRRAVILGSGDIGLIMARRMILEGAEVAACVEIMDHPGGLTRNVVQCLNDFDIPLYLSHTITRIRGKRRVESVTVCPVDERQKPVPGKEMELSVDTVLLSVGLIPENELTKKAGIEMDETAKGPACYENMETSAPGVFACGNVAHVHDLVDYVSAESEKAGRAAAEYARGIRPGGRAIGILRGEGVSYAVPQKIRPEGVEKSCEVYFRVKKAFGKSRILLYSDGAELAAFKRDFMVPGETQRIRIPKVLLQKTAGDITISLEEEKL